MPKSTKKPAAKAVKKASPKSKAPAKKKASARTAATARTAPRRTAAKPQTTTTATITIEAISLKAYYLAERRRHLGIPGDPQSDWLEAERILRQP